MSAQDSDTQLNNRQQEESLLKKWFRKKEVLLRRLFRERFLGVVYLDCKTQKLGVYDEQLTGKFSEYINPDGGFYNEEAARVIREKLCRDQPEAALRKLTFESLKSELENRSAYEADFYIPGADGNHVYIRVSFEYEDESKERIMIFAEDVTKLISGEIDPLTGRYNSTGFYKRIEEWIADHPGRRYRLHLYDLDYFKDINGVYGYKLSDRLLRDIGEYMRKYDTPDSFSAHLNDNRFARFCADDGISVPDCYNNFVQCFSSYNLSIPINMHMGVYNLFEDDKNPSSMSYKAQLALQEIESDMNKRIGYYEHGMLDRETERLQLLKDAETAIGNEEFEVWFQPQVDYAHHRFFGAEALVRWRHHARGFLSPAEFIPLLEKSNYIGKVDLYVIQKTCEYMRRWLDILPESPFTVSVNLSRKDVLNPLFSGEMENIVEKYGVPRERLRLEITESAYMQDGECLHKEVAALRERGFAVEIDDFGAGYSSLNSLKDMNFDKLKLDMKFLSQSCNAAKGKIILSSVIQMSLNLGVPVIAEGVETKAQADMLLSFGCEEMQGYYFAKPMRAEDFGNLLLGKTSLPNL